MKEKFEQFSVKLKASTSYASWMNNKVIRFIYAYTHGKEKSTTINISDLGSKLAAVFNGNNRSMWKDRTDLVYLVIANARNKTLIPKTQKTTENLFSKGQNPKHPKQDPNLKIPEKNNVVEITKKLDKIYQYYVFGGGKNIELLPLKDGVVTLETKINNILKDFPAEKDVNKQRSQEMHEKITKDRLEILKWKLVISKAATATIKSNVPFYNTKIKSVVEKIIKNKNNIPSNKLQKEIVAIRKELDKIRIKDDNYLMKLTNTLKDPQEIDENETPNLKEATSRRDFLKILTAAGVLAVGSVIAPKTLNAKKSPDNLDNPNEVEKKELKAVIEDALNYKKYTENSKEFRDTNDGYHSFDKKGYEYDRFGIYTGFTKKQVDENLDILKNWNYVGGRDVLLKRDIPAEFRKAYQNFIKQLSDTMELINSTTDRGGMFINGNTAIEGYESHGLNEEILIFSAYNRLIATGMMQEWNEEKFVTATNMFKEKVGTENLPEKLTGKNGMLGDVQMRKIEYTLRAFNNTETYEYGYQGEATPMQRAKEKYPDNHIKQFIFAANIQHAELFRWVRENPVKTKSFNAQQASIKFSIPFYPPSI